MRRLAADFLNVLLDTEEFFREARKRGGRDALAYFAFISLISLLINWLLLWQGITPAGLIPFEEILTPGVELLGWYIPLVFFIVGFGFSALYAALVRFFLGRRGISLPYREVYKVMAYGFTPSLITLWIPVLGLLLVVWSLYLQTMGLAAGNGAGLRKNAAPVLAGGAITAVVVMAFLFLIAASLITLSGRDFSLLWTVISL